MKFKKVLAAVLAGVMVMATASTVMAATTLTLAESSAWWTVWTEGYEVADGATLEFETTQLTAGGAVYQSLNAVFVNVYTDGVNAPADNDASYAEYVVLRSDNYGWGTLYEAGNVTYTGTEYLYVDDATDYGTLLTGATYAVTITRSGDTINYDYVITESDGTVLNCGYEITGFGSDAVYVFFTGDSDTSFGAASSSDDTSSDDTSSDDASSDDTSSDDASTADDTTSSDTTETTGDAAPVVAVVVALAGCAAIAFASKKRFAK